MKKISTILLLFLSTLSLADSPQLQNLTPSNVDDVFKTFGALTNFRPMEPASAWADWFGVSLGVAAQATPSRKLKAVIPNSGSVPSYLPDAMIVLALQGPWGLGLEGGLFPTTDVKDIRVRQYAANLKWTMNKVLFTELPFDVAFRAGVSKPLVSFKYNISGVQDTVEYTNTTWNFSGSVSKRLSFIEPYVGAGLTTQSGKLNNEGRINLLNQEFTLRNSLEKSYTSFLGYAGIQFHIFFMNITTQVDYQNGFANFGLKLAAKF